jgi:hypothetical protein
MRADLLDGRQLGHDLLAADLMAAGLHGVGGDGCHLQLPHVVPKHVAAQRTQQDAVTGPNMRSEPPHIKPPLWGKTP